MIIIFVFLYFYWLFLYFPYFTPVLYKILFLFLLQIQGLNLVTVYGVQGSQSIAGPSANLPVNQTLTLEVGKVVLETLFVHQKHQRCLWSL